MASRSQMAKKKSKAQQQTGSPAIFDRRHSISAAGVPSPKSLPGTFGTGARVGGKNATDRQSGKDLSNHNKYCHFCQHVKVRSSSMLACGNYECSRRYCEQCLLIHLNENATEQPSEGWSIVAGKLRWFCPICRNKCCCAKSECFSNHRHCKAFRYRLCRAQKAQKRLSSQGGPSRKARAADGKHKMPFAVSVERLGTASSTEREEEVREELCAANPFFGQEHEEPLDEALDFTSSLCGDGMARPSDTLDEGSELRLWQAGEMKEETCQSDILSLEHVLPGALEGTEADEDFEEARWLKSTLEGLGSSPSCFLEDEGLKEEAVEEPGMKELGSSFLERFQSELKPRRGCTVIYDYV
ncbi:hypothetical protein GUITHDRAFT_133559 [Guillardia theta CCMP2712]|uniref:Zinc-finger domain-containing protein n=1 Tax=Guillardia theta (strain CCMP2712) TaxID=905079 RepID=L1JVX4_GUITC|nr:hypothetical protein GUITHDRAFT_133559 [Guillardia theta CCMP2712]EKX52474.1 hypothetical protein GUITHDRAFT_133559 [Guillardia theta CCMP2712]|eukprot:XP_005839454.1 hypothetical protein GUITHDRAFT_133559 [Guillardia theta CCMP2712]